jgi:DNA-binding NtrC family response regulator
MRNKSILLIDDELPILTSLGNYLEQNAFHVQLAICGKDALVEFHSDHSFDLVITDLVMNDLNGLEILKEIKKINYEIGVFILTGQGKMSLAIEALRAGADDFILKPCDADELIIRMERFFEKQDLLRKIKIYEDFLPICMYCKQIRDDSETEPGKGKWMRIEEYICRKSGTDLTHGCCPECFEAHKAEWKIPQ